MCNLSEGVFEQGVEKGFRDGWLIGMRRSAYALMETLRIPADEAMEILKISNEDRAALKKSLKNNI